MQLIAAARLRALGRCSAITCHDIANAYPSFLHAEVAETTATAFGARASSLIMQHVQSARCVLEAGGQDYMYEPATGVFPGSSLGSLGGMLFNFTYWRHLRAWLAAQAQLCRGLLARNFVTGQYMPMGATVFADDVGVQHDAEDPAQLVDKVAQSTALLDDRLAHMGTRQNTEKNKTMVHLQGDGARKAYKEWTEQGAIWRHARYRGPILR